MFPDEWKVQSLPSVVFFQEGPGLRKWQFCERGMPFINIRCIRNNGTLDLSEARYISAEEAHQKYEHFFLEEDDTVLSSSGTLGRMGVVRKGDLPLMLNTSVIRFRTLDEAVCITNYMRHFLRSQWFREQIIRESQGSAQANFGPSHLKKALIALPPLPEQRKIAAILSSVDTTIEKTEAVIEQLQVVKKAVMQELLTRGLPGRHTRFKKTEIGEIPAEWGVVLFERMATVDTGFAFKSCDFVDPNGDSVPIIRMSNLRNGIVTLKNAKHIPSSLASRDQRFALSEGDFLVGLSGSLGNYAWVRASDLPCYLNQRVGRIRPKPETDPLFVTYLYLSDRIQDLVEARAAGLAQANVSPRSIRELPVVMPQYEEQQEIARVLASLDGRLSEELRFDQGLHEVKKALMSVLLTGEVRVTPSEDVQ